MAASHPQESKFLFRAGTQTAKRTESGCTIEPRWGQQLEAACGSNGHATLTYDFTLPSGVGSVYPQVDGYQWCSGPQWLKAVMVRVNARTVHEVIPVPARCTVYINSVRIHYFQRG